MCSFDVTPLREVPPHGASDGGSVGLRCVMER